MDESPARRVAGRGVVSRVTFRSWLGTFFILSGIFFLADVALGPINCVRHMRQNTCIQQLHVIGIALYAYTVDHSGEYPDGNSSTEVFQKLVDGGYITDLHVFYVTLGDKVEPTTGQKKLRPENVGFDVTGGLARGDSDAAPLVFLTGFRVKYAPGLAAVPLGPEFPVLETSHHFLGFSWMSSDDGNDRYSPGTGVFYMSNSAMWKLAQGNVVPNFVPPEFDAHGKTYRQLTPEGVLR